MKILIFTKVCLFSLSLLNCHTAVGQSDYLNRFDSISPASGYAESIQQARQEIEVLMNNGSPGISIAVGVAGEIIWAEGFGYADVESRTLVTPLTKFRIGSISKTMTSIALGLLYEQKIIDLDAPIQTYVESFPLKPEGDITLRQLASHQSGIRHYLPDFSDYINTDHYDDVLDSLHLFANDPLLFEPGQGFEYSSYGYNLISAAIQEASGMKFLEYMRSEVWGPLNLLNTVADHSDYIIENRAAPYLLYDSGKLRNAPYADNSHKWAGGGFLSTPSDLVSFAFGVDEGEILGRETLELLFTPAELSEGVSASREYGLGWQTYSDDGAWIGHGGSSIGGSAILRFNRAEGVAYAILCNVNNCFNSNPNLGKLRELFLQ